MTKDWFDIAFGALMIAYVFSSDPATSLARFVFALFGLTLIIRVFFGSPYDSTDDGERRRGLKIHTDHHTGVQYLGTARGGLTPRVRMDGTVIVVDDGGTKVSRNPPKPFPEGARSHKPQTVSVIEPKR